MPPQMRWFHIYNMPMPMRPPRMMPSCNMRPPQQQMINMPPQQVEIQKMDSSARADYYGEQLFTKISRTPAFANYANYFSKIVGIFLDLEDAVFEKLLKDDKHFHEDLMGIGDWVLGPIPNPQSPQL